MKTQICHIVPNSLDSIQPVGTVTGGSKEKQGGETKPMSQRDQEGSARRRVIRTEKMGRPATGGDGDGERQKEDVTTVGNEQPHWLTLLPPSNR